LRVLRAAPRSLAQVPDEEGVANTLFTLEGKHFSYPDPCLELSAALAMQPSFTAPAEKPVRALSENKFILPVEQRLVGGVEANRWEHFAAALASDPPSVRWRDRYILPDTCERALAAMLQKRSSLLRWRQQQVEVLRSVARRAQDLTRTLKALPLASSSDTNLEVRVRQINVAMLCLFCDVLGHPDTELPSRYLTGFNVSGVIKPSGASPSPAFSSVGG